MEENRNTAGLAGSGGDIFSALLKNPELISKISNLLSGLNLSGAGGSNAAKNDIPGSSVPKENMTAGAESSGNEPQENGAEAFADTSKNGGTGSSDISGRLASLLSNKELMSMLPDIISALKPPSSQGAAHTDEAHDEAVPAGALIPGGHHRKYDTKKRNALMIALKPYLNRRRREAIDYILRVDKLGDIFRTLG